MERLVQDNSGDCIDPIRSATREQKHTVNRKKKTEKVYSCRICHKDFNSTSGLNVHVRAHKSCKGCNKVFPSKIVFNSHKSTCQKYKKLMRKRGRPLKQKETVSSSCMPSVSHKKHYMQCQVNEKTIKCSLCPRSFQLNKHLKLHMTRIHMKKKNLSNTNEDSSWTMPLELTDTLSLWQVSHFNRCVSVRHTHSVLIIFPLKDSFCEAKTQWKNIYFFYFLLYLPTWYLLTTGWSYFLSWLTV